MNTRSVTLPEGVSLERVGQVLRDAWDVGSHQWKDTPLQLREGQTMPPPAPIPRDAVDLFRMLQARQIPYLLVGGMAMLTYIEGRNTKDVDLLLSAADVHELPEFSILERQEFFVLGQFRTIRVDLLLTTNPFFKIIGEQFATKHHFAEIEVPAASVEGLILLKLYALPSLYRQLDWDKIYIYESDIKQLMARYNPDMAKLFDVLQIHIMPSDLRELKTLVAEEQQRRARFNEPPRG